jgi:small-conductance mechanosensitive channel
MEGILRTILGVGTVFAQDATPAKSESINLVAFILSNLPLWITAAVILVASIVIAFIVKKTVESRLAAKVTEEHQEILLLSGRVSFVSVAAFGITVALAVAGINLTSVIAAVAFGISFGLQDTIANFVAGLGILASKPFTIGDWIKVEGQMGKVENIKTRTTFLKTYNGERLIVPNATLYKGNVMSYTSNPLRRIKVPVYPRYECDWKDVIKLCMNVAKSNPKIYQEPKPNVVFIDFMDYYVWMELRFWVDSKGMWRRIQSDVFSQIQNKLFETGMYCPYPVTNLSFVEEDENFLDRQESYVWRTKDMSPEDMKACEQKRMESLDKFAKARQELYRSQTATAQAVPADTSGAAFLKTEAGTPIPSANQASPSVLPNFGATPPGNTPPAENKM